MPCRYFWHRISLVQLLQLGEFGQALLPFGLDQSCQCQLIGLDLDKPSQVSSADDISCHKSRCKQMLERIPVSPKKNRKHPDFLGFFDHLFIREDLDLPLA